MRSYNARVKLGLMRGVSALMPMEEAEENRKWLNEEHAYKRMPTWA